MLSRKLFRRGPIVIGACLLLCWLVACSNRGMLNSMTPDSGFSLAGNIVYDTGSQLRLDVYSPPGVANAPVIVFFYGGRWSEGSKDQYRFVGQALAARGIVAVIPDVRLYPAVKFPTFLYDCAHAVMWAHQNIVGYGGSPDKIVVMGHSSGAYDAAMLALAPEIMRQAGGDRGWIRGMIGLAGPYDFLPITDPDLRDLFGPPEMFQNAQPVMHVDGTNPPLLLMHGGADDTVNISNTVSLFTRVQRANGPVEKVIYPDLDHKWIIADVAARYQSNADIVDHIQEFTRRVTSAPPAARPAASSIQTFVPQN